MALITTLVPFLGSSGDDKVAGPIVGTVAPGSTPITVPITVPVTVPVTVRTTVQTTVQTTVRPTAPPPVSRSSETPLPSVTAGTVLWQGSLPLDTYAKDLDAVPPAPVADYGSDGDVYMLLGQQLSAMNRTLLSRWTKRPSLPGYQGCADAIREGNIQDQQPLSKSTVLCLQTSEGSIARLRVTALPENQYGTGYRAVFDVVVWSGS